MTTSEARLRKALYSVNETMEVLSMGRTSLYELVKRGELNPAKLGAKTMFFSDDIAALLARLREQKAVALLGGRADLGV